MSRRRSAHADSWSLLKHQSQPHQATHKPDCCDRTTSNLKYCHVDSLYCYHGELRVRHAGSLYRGVTSMLGQRSTATCSRHAGPVTFGSYPFGLEQLDFSNCSIVCAWRFRMTWSPFCFWRIEAPHRRRQPWYYGYSRRPCRTLIGFYWVMSRPDGSAEEASPRIVRPRLKQQKHAFHQLPEIRSFARRM